VPLRILCYLTNIMHDEDHILLSNNVYSTPQMMCMIAFTVEPQLSESLGSDTDCVKADW